MAAKPANPKRIINNIYYMAKEKEIRIGELETAAGVSTGYLSRLNRDDNTTVPSLEALSGIAERLEVTIDYLVSSDLAGMSKGEQYILGFLEKVVQDTIDETLEWVKETPAMLREIPVTYGEPDHPLFELRSGEINTVSGYPASEVCYFSRFTSDQDMVINGDCYNTLLPFANARVYVMNVAEKSPLDGSKSHEVEIYLLANGVQPICASVGYRKEIENAVKKVYGVIQEMYSRKGLKRDVKNVLDMYMKGLYISDDDIPF